MKKFLVLLMVPVLMMVLATPVLAQVSLPYTAPIIPDSQGAAPVGDLTITSSGMVIFQIDEAGTSLRLSETLLYVGDEPPVKIKPDKYPYKHQGLGGTASDVYSIDLTAADLNGDGIIYIAAQVGLVMPTTLSLKAKKAAAGNQTAWAQGDEFSGKGKNSNTFFSVTLIRPG
jgi:hypothetical protein